MRSYPPRITTGMAFPSLRVSKGRAHLDRRCFGIVLSAPIIFSTTASGICVDRAAQPGIAGPGNCRASGHKHGSGCGMRRYTAAHATPTDTVRLPEHDADIAICFLRAFLEVCHRRRRLYSERALARGRLPRLVHKFEASASAGRNPARRRHPHPSACHLLFSCGCVRRLFEGGR